MINSMEKEYKLVMMVQNIKANLEMVVNKEKGSLFGKIIHFIKEILKRIWFVEMVNTYGTMERYIMANGKIIKWMEKVNLYGQMDENILGNIKMTRNMDMVFFIGQIIVDIKVIGGMENSIIKEYISLRVGMLAKENGITGKN